MMKQYLCLIKRSLLATREMGFVIEMTYQFSAMHMTAMLDYECLNCCWVNAHILDGTIFVENMGMGI